MINETMITLTVNPSQYGGTEWHATVDDALTASGGSEGRSKGERTEQIEDWVPAIRRAMRDCGIDGRRCRLDTAKVEPHGWSLGPGHAPQGVRVVWRWR
jgi:hypothetical protein